MTQQVSGENISLHVRNIGGISETTVDFTPGVTILTGRNATNRTSLLQAIMTVHGSDAATIKAEAEEAHVELTIGDSTYTRHLYRQNGSIITEGDPYLEDPTLADLFSFLLENNDARQTVPRDEDLRDVIMRPIDTNKIKSDISRLKSQKEDTDRQIENITKLKKQVPELERKKSELSSKITDKKDKLSDKEEKIQEINEDGGKKTKSGSEFEEKFDALHEVRRNLQTVRDELDSQKDSLDALKDERSDLRSESERYKDIPEGRTNEIKAEIDRLRTRKEKIGNTLNEIQTVIEFNEELLDGSHSVFTDIYDGHDGTDPTEKLLTDDDELVCWTCGSDIDTSQIERMLKKLRDLRDQYVTDRSELTEQIGSLNDERRELEERLRSRELIEEQLGTIEEEIQQREARVDELRRRRDELTDQVASLEKEVEQFQREDKRDSELLDRHKEANRLEVEIERLESDLEDVTAEISRIEDRIADLNELETKRSEIQSEMQDLRTRVKRLEEEAVEAFNEHMSAVLNILNYDNINRVWIERTQMRSDRSRTVVTEGRFEIHVVRSTDSETVYEDTVDHLSESEREVTGLVFALAGYLVHNVHEVVPFMLLDSVEAIDAPRIAALVDYFKEYANYLVVALLEEDAEALSERYERITSI
jgi:DNA repair exonuclease SbcCD ATPase subunit